MPRHVIGEVEENLNDSMVYTRPRKETVQMPQIKSRREREKICVGSSKVKMSGSVDLGGKSKKKKYGD